MEEIAKSLTKTLVPGKESPYSSDKDHESDTELEGGAENDHHPLAADGGSENPSEIEDTLGLDF